MADILVRVRFFGEAEPTEREMDGIIGPMDIDRILLTFNKHQVQFLVVGGVNFLLQHEPVLTYDLDLWIEPALGNRAACEQALVALDAEWGKTDDCWQKVASYAPGWLDSSQGVYCLASPSGAIDVFLEVKGLEDWDASRAKSIAVRTSAGTECRGLDDDDMLACQLALEPNQRKQSRVEYFLQRKGRT